MESHIVYKVIFILKFKLKIYWPISFKIYVNFLIIKPTRYINFSNLFLGWNSACFRQFLCPSSGVFPVHTAMVYVIQVCWHILLLCVQWRTPDDGQRNCPKHVNFHSKNKIEKLMYLVGFIIRNVTRCTVTRTSNYICPFSIHHLQ